MDDLISRAAAVRIIADMHGLCRDDVLRESIQAIKELAAVDAAPVVHARPVWINPFNPGAKMCAWKCTSLCSACGDCVATSWKYCPNCGARMGGETDG